MRKFNEIHYGPWQQNDNSKEGLALRDAGTEPVSRDFIAKLDTIEHIAFAEIFNTLVWSQYGPFMDRPCRTCQDPISTGVCFTFFEDKGDIVDTNEWKEEYQHYMIKHNVSPTPEFEALVDKIFSTLDLQRFHAPKTNYIYHRPLYDKNNPDSHLNKEPVSDAFLKTLDKIEEKAKTGDDKNLFRFDSSSPYVCPACDDQYNNTTMIFLDNKEEVMDVHVWESDSKHFMIKHNIQPIREFETLIQKISAAYNLG